jgi:hypothetical protein
MSLLLVLGSIAAIIYIILRMRLGVKQETDKTNDSNKQDFVRDVFDSSKNIRNTDHDKEDELLINDPYDDLERLATLYDKGILTKDEFEAKKKDILERI